MIYARNIIAAVIVIIFTNSFSYAQVETEFWKEFEHTMLTSSSFIFEGVSTQQKYYHKNYQIYTCTIIEIKKIFKGSPQIKLGSIRVITKQDGGEDGGPKIYYSNPTPALRSGVRYILMGEIADSSFLTDNILNADNSISIFQMQIPIRFANDRYGLDVVGDTALWGSTGFKTASELYAFLNKNAGLNVQEQIVEPVIAQPVIQPNKNAVKVKMLSAAQGRKLDSTSYVLRLQDLQHKIDTLNISIKYEQIIPKKNLFDSTKAAGFILRDEQLRSKLLKQQFKTDSLYTAHTNRYNNYLKKKIISQQVKNDSTNINKTLK